jgi:hypothetical protein
MAGGMSIMLTVDTTATHEFGLYIVYDEFILLGPLLLDSPTFVSLIHVFPCM